MHDPKLLTFVTSDLTWFDVISHFCVSGLLLLLSLMLWCSAPEITSLRMSLHGPISSLVLEVSSSRDFAFCGPTSILLLSRTNHSLPRIA